jgi:hypothetical protein
MPAIGDECLVTGAQDVPHLSCTERLDDCSTLLDYPNPLYALETQYVKDDTLIAPLLPWL